MGKRSDFKRAPRDYYQTPLDAVRPLAKVLPSLFTYCEPCAGDGRLIRHLEVLNPASYCTRAFDIEPDTPYHPGLPPIEQRDALSLSESDMTDENGISPDFIITNPPWSRDKRSGYLLHRMIETFAPIAPTWLLFDADWPHTVQAKDYVDEFMVLSMAIGRVRWIEGTTMSGKDNVCWYLFDKDAKAQRGAAPAFYGRNMWPQATDLLAA